MLKFINLSILLLLQPIPPKLIPIPGHGRLRMVVPMEWRVSARSNEQPAAATVHIVPETGDAWDIRITAIWLSEAARAKSTPEVIRANVKRSAEALLVKSEDKSVVMEDLRGEQVSGNYFTLADSNPGPGEYRYVTQGSFRTGDLLTAFTILHRAPDSAEVKRALQVLSGATHVP